MEKQLIYAVDDESSIREIYDCALSSAGYAVQTFSSGAELFSGIKKELPDLFILDVMLEGMDGFEILKALQSATETAKIPAIMVSAKGAETDKVKGLNLGADDYLAKPFGVMELLARIGARLRKSVAKPVNIAYKDLAISDDLHSATLNGVPLDLTVKEYELLKLLLKNVGTVLRRDDILDAVWGENYGETRTLDMHVASLRKAIAGSSAEIVTIRSVGYTLK